MWDGEIQMQYNGESINPYDIMGLSQQSNNDSIKATCKSSAKIYHPDIGTGGDIAH